METRNFAKELRANRFGVKVRTSVFAALVHRAGSLPFVEGVGFRTVSTAVLIFVLFSLSATTVAQAQSQLQDLSEIRWQTRRTPATIGTQSSLGPLRNSAAPRKSLVSDSKLNLAKPSPTRTRPTPFVPSQQSASRRDQWLSSIDTTKNAESRPTPSQIALPLVQQRATTTIETLPEPTTNLRRLPITVGDFKTPSPAIPSESPNALRDEMTTGEEIVAGEVRAPEISLAPAIPDPWWSSEIQAPLLENRGPGRSLGLMECVHLALQNAPQIEVIRAEVGIRKQEIVRQSAVFDWTSFLESQWQDLSEPVGDQLQGAQNRFRDNNWTARGGVRRRNLIGGQVEIGQELGHRNTNSQFFTPPNQGSSRVVFEYTQPLLRGSGHVVNHSIVEIAIADSVAADNAFVAQLQDYILEVIRAYWSLVRIRGELAILRESVDRAEKVVSKFEARQDVDVNPLQMVRARASAAARSALIVQAENNALQAQDGLLQLVYGARFREHADGEIIPLETLSCPDSPSPMHQIVEKGLRNRPELRETMQLIKRASIEQGVAKNDLLPILDLTLSVSNSALRGNSDVHRAWLEQFNLEEPSYIVGFSFEYPLGNRAARARHEQTLISLRRFQKQFETVVADVTLEVRNSVRDVVAARNEFQAKADALTLAQKETFLIDKRYELLLDGNEVGRLYLSDLLQTQERLAQAELDTLTAQAKCAASQFELERTTGTLLQFDASGTDH